jgi:hypothetical protein
MTFELCKCTELDDRAVAEPGHIKTAGQFVNGTCAGGTPDHEAYCGGAEVTDNQGKILHSVCLLLGPVYC